MTREASFTAHEETHFISYSDGTQVALSKPVYSLIDPYMPLPGEVMISPRVAPAVFGLGLVDAIPENAILANADEFDVNADGISGKPNLVWSIEKGDMVVGRFGWKAENPTTLQQTADAYHQDMGITSDMFVAENCSGQENCDDDLEVDITHTVLEATAFYFQSLGVPAVRNFRTEAFEAGKQHFEALHCQGCHIPSFTTGEGVIPELTNQQIFPYSDFLLHDMGEGLADNRPSYRASGSEWRTPPLWGIGLMPVVNGHTRLLHDGRAANIEEAILWHEGEAESSRNAFLNLSKQEREELIQFVKSL